MHKYTRVARGRFAEVWRRRELKVNAGECKVMVLNGEGLEFVVYIDGIHLEFVSEFKYLECFGQIR